MKLVQVKENMKIENKLQKENLYEIQKQKTNN